MKNRGFSSLLIIAALWLLLAVSGCTVEREQPGSDTVATEPIATEAPRPMPQPDDVTLELDGLDLGQVFRLDETAYLLVDALTEPLQLTVTEPEPEALRIQWEESFVTLRDGTDLAETSDGREVSLQAPVLHEDARWYLPVSALETLWGRKTVCDPDGGLLRCFHTEPGPALQYNGGFSAKTVLLGDVPGMSATAFCNMTGGSLEESTDENRIPVLTVNAQDRVFTFRSGSPRAELDGEALSLPGPVWTDLETWYLPVAAAEALGCVIWEDDEAGLIEVWQATEGPELWFDGTGMRSYTCAKVPCVALSALAEAVGGALTPRGNGISLTVGDHEIFFQTASQQAIVNGTPLTLPIPVLPYEEQLLVPAEPLAEALQIPKLEGETLIFSRMEPRDTVVWVDGRDANTYGIGEDDLFLRLNDVFFYESNEPVLETNTVEFTALGKRITLTGGSSEAMADGEAISLSAPVRVDGEAWYAPTGLLTALGLTELQDPDLDQIYYTHIVRNDALAEGYRVPVLMYHAVSDNIWGIPELFISPSTLEKQIQALLEEGYTAITFEDLDRIEEIEKPVMLTFDDGYDDNYTELFPLLQKYQVKATVFVIVNDLGKNHKLTKAQVKEMSDSGLVSIQSHTLSHNYLDEMYESQLIKEHYGSMLGLARITGKQPFVMCYPTGKSSGYSRKITAQYYEYGLCMGGPCWVTGDAPYRIYRYYIPRKTTLDTFLSYLAG